MEVTGRDKRYLGIGCNGYQIYWLASPCQLGPIIETIA